MKKFFVLINLIFVVVLPSSDVSYFHDQHSLYQELLNEECRDCCQQDSACCLVPYAVKELLFTGIDIGVQSLGSSLLAAYNCGKACIKPIETASHPCNALRSVLYPLAHIGFIPVKKFYRIVVCVKSLNPEYFAERELAKIKGAWLEKNCRAEDFFAKNPEYTSQFWHPLNRLYLVAQGKKSHTLSEKGSNKFLVGYYKKTRDFFSLSLDPQLKKDFFESRSKQRVESKFEECGALPNQHLINLRSALKDFPQPKSNQNDDLDNSFFKKYPTVDLQEAHFKELFLHEHRKSSIAQILFKRGLIKQRAKLNVSNDITQIKFDPIAT